MKTKIINVLLKINEDEWQRLGIAWMITFLAKTGLVIGWTLLVATFLHRIGINQLPFLFILNAVLSMTGIFVYSGIINRVKVYKLIILTCLTSIILLYFSRLFIDNKFLFISSIIVTQSLLLTQLNIFLSLFIESMFSPLESQRMFPLIESAQTVGGIFGGLIIILLANKIATYNFVHVWSIILGLIIITVLIYKSFEKKLPFLKITNQNLPKYSNLEVIKTNIEHIKKTPFLVSLMIVLFLQIAFSNLLEFQFTKAIHQDVTNTHEQTIVKTDNQSTAQNLKTSLLENLDEKAVSGAPVLQNQYPKETHTYEQNITFDLGSLNIVIYGFTLVVQLFTASRLLKSLGTVNSMLVNTVVNLFSMIGLTLHYSFTTSAITKTGYESTHPLFQNAYHATYYNLNEGSKKQTKELFEGVIKPLGAIFGMIILITFTTFSNGLYLTTNINLIMMGFILVAAGTLLKMRKSYTRLAINQLKNSQDNLIQKINAIETLVQKGHISAKNILIKTLQHSEHKIIKIKILDGLGDQKYYETIPEILDCVEDEDEDIRLAAIESLGKFENLGIQVYSQAFSKHRVITTLKKLFIKEKSEYIRMAIVEVLAKLDKNEIARFLIRTLKQSKDQNITADCIYLCKLFDDPNIAYYLLPYLKSSDLETKAHTIVALWKIKKYRVKLKKIIQKMLTSKSADTLSWACYIIGETGRKRALSFLLNNLNSSQKNIQRQAALALSKHHHIAGYHKMAELLTDKDHNFMKKTQQLTKKLPLKTQKQIYKMLNHDVSVKINKIINQNAHRSSFEEFPLHALEKLKFFYSITGQAECEKMKLDKIIMQNQKKQLATEQITI